MSDTLPPKKCAWGLDMGIENDGKEHEANGGPRVEAPVDACTKHEFQGAMAELENRLTKMLLKSVQSAMKEVLPCAPKPTFFNLYLHPRFSPRHPCLRKKCSLTSYHRLLTRVLRALWKKAHRTLAQNAGAGAH